MNNLKAKIEGAQNSLERYWNEHDTAQSEAQMAIDDYYALGKISEREYQFIMNKPAMILSTYMIGAFGRLVQLQTEYIQQLESQLSKGEKTMRPINTEEIMAKYREYMGMVDAENTIDLYDLDKGVSLVRSTFHQVPALVDEIERLRAALKAVTEVRYTRSMAIDMAQLYEMTASKMRDIASAALGVEFELMSLEVAFTDEKITL